MNPAVRRETRQRLNFGLTGRRPCTAGPRTQAPHSSSAEETGGGVGAPEAASPRHRRPASSGESGTGGRGLPVGRGRSRSRKGRGFPGAASLRVETFLPAAGREAAAARARVLTWPALRRGRSLLLHLLQLLVTQDLSPSLGPLLHGPHLHPLSVSPRRPIQAPSHLLAHWVLTRRANPGSSKGSSSCPPCPPVYHLFLPPPSLSGLCPPQCWGFLHPKPQEGQLPCGHAGQGVMGFFLFTSSPLVNGPIIAEAYALRMTGGILLPVLSNSWPVDPGPGILN